jgi:hypothetical protein
MDRSAETGPFLLVPPGERWLGVGHPLIPYARGKAFSPPIRRAPISAATKVGIPGGTELDPVQLAQGETERIEE